VSHAPSHAPRRTYGQRQREQRGWYFYDWANSAFSTTVVTVFLGPYLTTIAENAADSRGFVHPLGIPVRDGSFFSYVVGLSVALQVIVLPVTGAIADRTRRKKQMLALFAYIGAAATIGMWFLQGERYLLGGALFLIANLAFGASVVVYNSFLPEIAEPDERDRVSARGWALGYLGGGLLLVVNLALYTARDRLGVSEGDAVRISILSAGLWWAIWTIVPLRGLQNRRAPAGFEAASETGGVVSGGFGQLARTLREARSFPQTLLFLVAYLFYNDGIQTVIVLAAVYGDKELGLGQTTLIVAILLVQFVAFAGALVMGRMAKSYGAKRVILSSLILWTAVLVAAFFLQAGAVAQFYLLALLIGFVLGGSQALSRSLFSQMIPPGREAEYFGLYEISERGTSWMGPIAFGLVYQATGSYRTAIIALVVFFVVGFLLLTRVDVRRAIREAGNEEPALV